jgi:hypothetical protein
MLPGSRSARVSAGPITIPVGIPRARVAARFTSQNATAFGIAKGTRIGLSRHDHHSNRITSTAKHGTRT